MKQISRYSLLVSLLSASVLFAQDSATTPAGHGMNVTRRVSFLTTLLNLTPNQQQQATGILTSASNASAALNSSMKTARANLATAVKNNDTASIEQISNTIGTLTAQSVANQAKANAAIRQMLTPEQQTKIDELQQQRHGRFHGFGAHGGSQS